METKEISIPWGVPAANYLKANGNQHPRGQTNLQAGSLWPSLRLVFLNKKVNSWEVEK